MQEWQMRGKEKSPKETVAKAEQILKELGFKTKIEETKQDLSDCYSCRLTLDGIAGGQIGTNGKGMSFELSHASAYGEMMERLSNRCFSPDLRRDDENYEDYLLNGAPLYAPSDPRQPACVFALKRALSESVKNESGLLPKDLYVDTLLETLAPEKLKGKFPTSPFYSVREDKTVYIPQWQELFVGSNGLAAGNTIEEALVEGISEILERYSFLQIMEKDIVMPRIPNEFLQKFPHIVKIIQEIEARGNYSVRVLDASLGKGVPSVCGIITEKETGRFGVKFGSHPNIAIALERIFTEAMQGSNLKLFCCTQADFSRTAAQRLKDKDNALKALSFNTPAKLLLDTPSYEFTAWGTETKSNRQRAAELIRLLEKLGGDVYIRDASYLGFPAVNIYAEGVSEACSVDIERLKTYVKSHRVMKYFRRIERLTEKEVKEIAAFTGSKTGALFEDNIGALSGLPFTKEMPGEWMEGHFLYAVCLWRLGKKQEAADLFREIAQKIASGKPAKIGWYRAIQLYTSGIAAGMEEQKLYEIMRNLCPANMDKAIEIFKDPSTLLEKIYPVCTDVPLSEITAGGCVYGEAAELHKKLVAAENANPQSLEYIRGIAKERC